MKQTTSIYPIHTTRRITLTLNQNIGHCHAKACKKESKQAQSQNSTSIRVLLAKIIVRLLAFNAVTVVSIGVIRRRLQVVVIVHKHRRIVRLTVAAHARVRRAVAYHRHVRGRWCGCCSLIRLLLVFGVYFATSGAVGTMSASSFSSSLYRRLGR